MSDGLEKIVDNMREGPFWIRMLLMIAFAIAAYFIIVPLVFVLSIAQALFTLITGQGNANLRYFSATLVLYVTQLVEFLTYLSEVKPYPFSDFPEVEDSSLEEQATPKNEKQRESKKADGAVKDETKVSATGTARKKPAAVKKTVTKKTVKKKAAKKAPKAAEKPGADAGSDS